MRWCSGVAYICSGSARGEAAATDVPGAASQALPDRALPASSPLIGDAGDTLTLPAFATQKFVSAQVGEVGGDILKAETVQLQGGPAVTMSTLQRILSTSSRGHHCSKAICSQSTRLCGVRWCAWPGGVCGLAGPARGLMGAVLAAAAFFAALSAHVNAVTLLSRPALPADCTAP